MAPGMSCSLCPDGVLDASHALTRKRSTDVTARNNDLIRNVFGFLRQLVLIPNLEAGSGWGSHQPDLVNTRPEDVLV